MRFLAILPTYAFVAARIGVPRDSGLLTKTDVLDASEHPHIDRTNMQARGRERRMPVRRQYGRMDRLRSRNSMTLRGYFIELSWFSTIHQC